MRYQVNESCIHWAKEAISTGKISQEPWSLDGEDKEKMLGSKETKDWEFYSQHFLGIDKSQAKDTEGRYHYPVGKGGVVYSRAVDAIRSRASQEGEKDIFEAAGEIEQAIKDYEQSKTKPEESEPKRELNQSIEYRHLAEVRVSEPTSDGSIGTVTGTIRFNSLSHDLGGFQERIDPAASNISFSPSWLARLRIASTARE